MTKTEYMREWRHKNRARIREYAHERYQRNREHILTLQRQSYLRHRVARIAHQKERWRIPGVRERHNELRRRNYAIDPTKRRLQYKLREAAIRANGERITESEWRNLLETYGNRCAYCGTFTAKLTIDHIMPISRGGTNSPGNVIPACYKCNNRKANSVDIRYTLPKLLTEGGRFLVPPPIFDRSMMLEVRFV